MARFFQLPIARRLADDPPSLEAFAAIFLRYQSVNPVNRLAAQRFFRRYVYSIPSYRHETTAINLNRDACCRILSTIADHCSENNFTHYRVLYDIHALSLSYEDVLSSTDTDSHDYDESMEYINEHFNVISCNDCGDSHPLDDMSHTYDDPICESCRERNYVWSSYEDTHIHNDYARDAIDSRGREVTIHEENGDFYYDDDDEVYYHQEYRRRDRIIFNYHSSKTETVFQHDDWTRKHKRFFGVELEVESVDGDRVENAKAIHERVNTPSRKLFFESDGSLTYGFEMITQPMSLPAHRELFKFLEDKSLTKNLKSHNTTTCGLHVHVSRAGMTDLQIGKIVSFVNDPKNEWFIRGIARRYASGFCQIKSKKVKDCRSGDRYEAVNLTNRSTIEFRLFKGSLKYEAVIAAVEFCNAIVEYTRPSVAGLRDLNVNRFLSFCHNTLTEETKILRKYSNSRMSGRIDISDAA